MTCRLFLLLESDFYDCPPSHTYLSAEEYLAWEAEQPIKHEYLNGEAYAMTTTNVKTPISPPDTIRVNALHALHYCSRLYYLEEVEQLYTQDDAVFAGRRLHVELEKDEDGDWQQFVLENEALGLRGKVDALRTRSGQTIPYEHKRGRCYRDRSNKPQAWESDRIQVLAYACLIEAELGITVPEGRVRYHADNVLVHVPLDAQGRQAVRASIERARQLRVTPERPPVTTNERLCGQ